LTYGGPVVGRIGPLVFHEPGVVLALQISLKSVAIVTAFIALVATMDIATLGHSLIRLKVPPKMAYLLLMTYRYIFVLEQEYHRLLRAARIRGFKPRTNLHSYRTYAYIVGMLFVRASNRAQRVHQAMKCRGFRGKFYSLARFEASGTSWLFGALMLLVCATLIILETHLFSVGLHG
jgi:cobalt/nickel transport system permease protein